MRLDLDQTLDHGVVQAVSAGDVDRHEGGGVTGDGGGWGRLGGGVTSAQTWPEDARNSTPAESGDIGGSEANGSVDKESASATEGRGSGSGDGDAACLGGASSAWDVTAPSLDVTASAWDVTASASDFSTIPTARSAGQILSEDREERAAMRKPRKEQKELSPFQILGEETAEDGHGVGVVSDAERSPAAQGGGFSRVDERGPMKSGGEAQAVRGENRGRRCCFEGCRLAVFRVQCSVFKVQGLQGLQGDVFGMFCADLV